MQPFTPSEGEESHTPPLSETVALGDASLPGEGAQIIPVEASSAAQVASTVTDAQASGQNRRIVSAAALIMLGQLLSSVLGMARIETINILFYGAASGAFIIALRPIQQLSDLLVGGSVSGA
ncbi:MAG TPA: hypothetical protein VIC27_01130, partial [Ktedonobacterales bacterium]